MKYSALRFHYQDQKMPLDCIGVDSLSWDRTLADDEVLLKVDYSTFNPNDMGWIATYHAMKGDDVGVGNEGTGMVVDAGSSRAAQSLKGKRVSAFAQGKFWSEYTVLSAKECVLIDSHLPVEQAAVISINPATVVGLVNEIKRIGSPGFIHTAGASQLGRMMVEYLKDDDLSLVNVVRRSEQIAELDALGSDETYSWDDEAIYDKLAEAVKSRGYTAIVDAISGETSSRLMPLLPKHGTLIVYGALSLEPVGPFNPLDMLYQSKLAQGFLVSNWLDQHDRVSVYQDIQQRLMAGSMCTYFYKEVSMNEAVEAMKGHGQCMSRGKILIKI